MTAKVKLYRYLKISIPQKMLVNQILIFQVVLILPKNYCSANHNLLQPLMLRKVTSPNWYHMKCRPDLCFSSVKNGWLCKICHSFSHGNAGNRASVDKPGKLGEHPSARFLDHLNSNHHNYL